MKENHEEKKRLIDILFKKAEGFKYCEEQYEYEKSREKVKPRYENLTFFQNFDRGNAVIENNDVRIEKTNEESEIKTCEELVLVKKKVTSHYIPPDMLAVKILLEIFGKEAISEDFDKMTDDELVKLKDQILGELKDEIDN